MLQSAPGYAPTGSVTPLTARGVTDVLAVIGKTIGPSPWRGVTQDDVCGFATLSGDHQWIHTDPERARSESPWGRTVVHGDLILSILNALRAYCLDLRAFEFALHRGWRDVLFVAHLPVGDDMRITTHVLRVNRLDGNWYEIIERHTAASRTEQICVAESVTWILTSAPTEASLRD